MSNVYEVGIVSSIGVDKLGLSARSAERLRDAYARAHCVGCGARVSHADRCVLKVHQIGEYRVFHKACSVSGPIEVRRRVLSARHDPAALAARRQVRALLTHAQAWAG